MDDHHAVWVACREIYPKRQARASRHGAQPVLDVLARPVLGQAVALLQLAFELIAAAIDLRQIIVGELAPFFLDLAFALFPASFQAIPIHRYFSTRFDG